MKKFNKKLIAALITTASLTLASAGASAADTDKVIGVMNGANITQGDVMTFIRLQGPNSGITAQTPNAQAQFLKLFVEREALYHEAIAKKLDKNSEVKQQLEEVRRQRLAQYILEDYAVKHQPSEAQIKEFYEKEVVANSKEFKLRHIQVQTPEQAKSAYQRLEKGDNFSAVAKDISSDSTDDLGWLSINAMPPAFAVAARSLKAGEYSKQPMQSERGFHIIKVDETRPVAAPALEQIKGQIANALTQQAMSSYIAEIKEKYKLEPK